MRYLDMYLYGVGSSQLLLLGLYFFFLVCKLQLQLQEIKFLAFYALELGDWEREKKRKSKAFHQTIVCAQV